MPSPDFHPLQSIDPAALADEARAGLLRPTASVSPKFFYDALGSRLFDAITELDEYYPTRTEAAIFAAHGAAMAKAVQARIGHGFSLVDLGAGDGAKAARLFPLLQPARYVAVDISVDHLRQSMQRLQREHPALPMVGVGLDFSQRLHLPATLCPGPALVFYPGSSIGNFDAEAAVRLLREARALSAGGALLIGVDLVKDTATLEAAYDDALGVTAAFNLNLLARINRELGGDFDLGAFEHRATFDPARPAMESWLVSRRAQAVTVAGRRFELCEGEAIRTEISWKYTEGQVTALARETGFEEVARFRDARGWFVDALWRAGPGRP